MTANLWSNLCGLHPWDLWLGSKVSMTFLPPSFTGSSLPSCREHRKLRTIQSSSDFIGQHDVTLVFYACVKSCASFAEAFARDYHHMMLLNKVAGTLNAPLGLKGIHIMMAGGVSKCILLALNSKDIFHVPCRFHACMRTPKVCSQV